MGDKNSKLAGETDYSAKLDLDMAELDKKRKKFKKENPQLASCLNKVATDYKNLSDYTNALKYELESLEMLKKLYPDLNHLHVAKSLNFISGLYSMLGDHKRSLDYSLDSYEIYQRFYKKSHADTAKQLNNLSTCYKNLNDFENAIRYASKCLKMRQELYKNEDHIDVAYSYSDVGHCYSRLGSTENGLKYSLRAEKIYEDLKTTHLHPDLAHLFNNIAMDYRLLGNHEKSFQYLKKSLEVILEVYSDNCVEIAAGLQSVGIGYKNCDDYYNCLKYCLISVKMYEKLENKSVETKYDSEIAELYSLIAMSYFYLNDRQNCLLNSLESLKYYEKYLDSKHPKIARTKNNISIAYGNLGDSRKALQYAQESLKIYKDLHKTKHVDIARALANVGTAHGNIGDPLLCLKYNQEALEMFRQIYNGDHYDVAYGLYNVACCYDDLGDKQNFLRFTHESLRMHQALANNRNSPDCVQLLKNTGLAYYKINDDLNSLKYTKEALKMAKSLYREPHPLIAITLYSIARCYRLNGDKRLEHENLLKALEMKHALKYLFDYDLQFDSSPEKFRFDEKQFKYKLKKLKEDGNKPNPKRHIMLSYWGDIRNRHECMEAREILENNKYRVYVNVSNDHGKSYDELMRAVDNSTIMIIFLNEEYIKNEYCKLEAAYAFKQNKKIIPIIIDPKEDSRLISEWLDQYKLEEKHCIYHTKYNFVNFSKILLNEINIKLNIISTNDSLIDSNLEDLFRTNQVNSNLLNKFRPYETEYMRSIAKLDLIMLQHALSFFRNEPNEFTDDDVTKFKLCLNQIFV